MRQTKKWANEEEQFIKDNYLILEYADIAKRLNRGAVSVKRKIDNLGLPKKIPNWTEEEDLKIIELTKLGLSRKSISEILNRTVIAINREIVVRKIFPNHNLSNTRVYNIWKHMKRRCLNKDCTAYENYGGRGISICNEWLNPINFINWSNNNGYEEHLTIDRIDNNGNYDPNNCRWTTMIEQANNTRRTKYLEAFGEKKTTRQWSEDDRCVVSMKLLHNRLKNGWTIEKAITTPKYENNN